MNNKLLILLIGGVVVIAGGLLLWRLSNNGAPASGVASIQDSVSSSSNSNAYPAPDFALQKLGGGTISLAEFRGKSRW